MRVTLNSSHDNLQLRDHAGRLQMGDHIYFWRESNRTPGSTRQGSDS